MVSANGETGASETRHPSFVPVALIYPLFVTVSHEFLTNMGFRNTVTNGYLYVILDLITSFSRFLPPIRGENEKRETGD